MERSGTPASRPSRPADRPVDRPVDRPDSPDGTGAEAFREVLKPVLVALGATLVPPEQQLPGDVPVVWAGEPIGCVRPPHLEGALHRLIGAVETELGAPLEQLSREDKQRAVRLLDERGAFVLRRSVDEVADALEVSRITIYNYLNATRGR